MKKLLLIVGLILGAASSQAFELTKAVPSNLFSSVGGVTAASCSSSCYTIYNSCISAGLPSHICNNNLNSCLSNCSGGNTNPPGPGTGPPRYDCSGLPKWSPFYCDPR